MSPQKHAAVTAKAEAHTPDADPGPSNPPRSAEVKSEQNPEDADAGDESDGAGTSRRKIKIEYITDKARRHITFSKRKAGIMKKAYELSTLTGTQVLLLIVSETGLVYTFTTPKLQPLVTEDEGKSLIQSCLASDEEGGLGNPMNDPAMFNVPHSLPPSMHPATSAPEAPQSSGSRPVKKRKSTQNLRKSMPSSAAPPIPGLPGMNMNASSMMPHPFQESLYGNMDHMQLPPGSMHAAFGMDYNLQNAYQQHAQALNAAAASQFSHPAHAAQMAAYYQAAASSQQSLPQNNTRSPGNNSAGNLANNPGNNVYASPLSDPHHGLPGFAPESLEGPDVYGHAV